MTIFSLEALQADHGDSLLLHYGSPDSPRLIIIDGGPKGIYKRSLAPRLKEIQGARGGGQLEVRMIMVSHIDDDHITGVLDLTKELCDVQKKGEPLPYDILTLWHNSFDDVIAKLSAEAQTHLRKTKSTGPAGEAIAASVPQGRQLRADASTLALNVNSGFDGLVQFKAPEVGKAADAINMGQGLKFTVLGPRKAELDNLQKDWAKKVKALLERQKAKVGAVPTAADLDAIAADFVDTSIPNLSSLVVLAECAGKSILLTGDARGDFVLDSLREAGLLKGGKLQINILKAPHHGSFRNVEEPFFQSIIADHYVFSANGKFDNPDVATLELLFKCRPEGGYTIWLTNPVEFALKTIREAIGDGTVSKSKAAPHKKTTKAKKSSKGKKTARVPNVTLKVRQDPARSVVVDLGDDKLTF